MTQEQYDRMYAILDDLYELAISNDEAKSRMDDLKSICQAFVQGGVNS